MDPTGVRQRRGGGGGEREALLGRGRGQRGEPPPDRLGMSEKQWRHAQKVWERKVRREREERRRQRRRRRGRPVDDDGAASESGSDTSASSELDDVAPGLVDREDDSDPLSEEAAHVSESGGEDEDGAYGGGSKRPWMRREWRVGGVLIQHKDVFLKIAACLLFVSLTVMALLFFDDAKLLGVDLAVLFLFVALCIMLHLVSIPLVKYLLPYTYEVWPDTRKMPHYESVLTPSLVTLLTITWTLILWRSVIGKRGDADDGDVYDLIDSFIIAALLVALAFVVKSIMLLNITFHFFHEAYSTRVRNSLAAEHAISCLVAVVEAYEARHAADGGDDGGDGGGEDGGPNDGKGGGSAPSGMTVPASSGGGGAAAAAAMDSPDAVMAAARPVLPAMALDGFLVRPPGASSAAAPEERLSNEASAAPEDERPAAAAAAAEVKVQVDAAGGASGASEPGSPVSRARHAATEAPRARARRGPAPLRRSLSELGAHVPPRRARLRRRPGRGSTLRRLDSEAVAVASTLGALIGDEEAAEAAELIGAPADDGESAREPSRSRMLRELREEFAPGPDEAGGDAAAGDAAKEEDGAAPAAPAVAGAFRGREVGRLFKWVRHVNLGLFRVEKAPDRRRRDHHYRQQQREQERRRRRAREAPADAPASAADRSEMFLDNVYAARRLARRVMAALRRDPKSATLSLEDFEAAMGPAMASRAFALFDLDQDAAVTPSEIRQGFRAVLYERRALQYTLADSERILGKLDLVLTLMFVIILFFLLLVVFNFDVGALLLSLSSFGVLGAFAAGSAISETINSISFLFVEHAFDVGDRISVEGVPYLVHTINITATVLRTVDEQLVFYPNHQLRHLKIHNWRRSGGMWHFVEMTIGVATPRAALERVREAFTLFLKADAGNFSPHYHMLFCTISQSAYMTMELRVHQRKNFQDLIGSLYLRSRVVLLLRDLLEENGIEVLPPTQRVVEVGGAAAPAALGGPPPPHAPAPPARHGSHVSYAAAVTASAAAAAGGPSAL